MVESESFLTGPYGDVRVTSQSMRKLSPYHLFFPRSRSQSRYCVSESVACYLPLSKRAIAQVQVGGERERGGEGERERINSFIIPGDSLPVAPGVNCDIKCLALIILSLGYTLALYFRVGQIVYHHLFAQQ